MSVEGFTPFPLRKLGGLVTRYAAELLPRGLAPIVRNARFAGKAAETREGLDLTYGMQIPSGSPQVTGLSALIIEASAAPWQTCIPLVYGSNGTLWKESPAGSGALTPITPRVGDALTAATQLEAVSAYGRSYMAFGDLLAGVGEPKQYDGTFLDRLGMDSNSTPAAAAASGSAGNVDAGTRYCVWMYRTRTEFLQGFARAAVFSCISPDGDHKILVTGLPAIADIPLNVTEIVLAFTAANDVQDGDYFYITLADTVGDVSIDSTIISVREDDGTPVPSYDGTAELNFTDAILTTETIATRCQEKFKLPAQTAVAFLKSLRRLCWAGEVGFNGFRLSEPDDPETYYETTGLVQPSPDDGQRCVGSIELEGGEILFLKERSAYSPRPTEGDPATWDCPQRWEGMGPCGPRAFAYSGNTLVFAHRSGGYIYTGQGPQTLTFEIEENNSGFDSPSWDGINWLYEHLIWASIDDVQKEIRFGVPYGNSTVPNIVFKCFFGDGLGAPAQEDANGNLVATEGRKWSVDDIPAFKAVRLWRTLQASPSQTAVDKRIATTQLLFASSVNDGCVNILNPATRSDNGHRINTVYQTAFVSKWPINKIGAVDVFARGGGLLSSSLLSARSALAIPLEDLELGDVGEGVTLYCDENGLKWAVLFQSGASDGDWISIQEIVLYLNQFWSSR